MNSVNLTPRTTPAGYLGLGDPEEFHFFSIGVFRRNVTGNKVTLAPVRGASWAGVFSVVLWCAMYLVRGCALVGSLAI